MKLGKQNNNSFGWLEVLSWNSENKITTVLADESDTETQQHHWSSRSNEVLLPIWNQQHVSFSNKCRYYLFCFDCMSPSNSYFAPLGRFMDSPRVAYFGLFTLVPNTGRDGITARRKRWIQNGQIAKWLSKNTSDYFGITPNGRGLTSMRSSLALSLCLQLNTIFCWMFVPLHAYFAVLEKITEHSEHGQLGALSERRVGPTLQSRDWRMFWTPSQIKFTNSA